ncbi:hypothetical protein WT26_30240 [Burkholderia cepacia]|uniref:histidine kinase n=2 Tax=Burkholderia cepacia complex TaxID=87882 RepID=A0A1B4Q1U6_BURCE|nr:MULTISPECIES: HAMP domain-containing sensor histidine kinase [Burkholderia cepacia complex]AOK20083.1 hypothetical protein WT26_30240 [Burkholderia cepacia]AOK26855.1 hypothetical protein WK67_30100 [Burkholderia ubonensis]
MKVPLGRLFWRCFLMLWLSMVAAFACAGFYIHVVGRTPPPPGQFAPALLLIPVLSGGMVALPVAFSLAWYLSKPLRHLSLALRDAARARFEVRVSPVLGSRYDEFAFLAQEFDDMASRLQHGQMLQRQLFHDVSHELRSPLARIQAAIGLMQQDPKMAIAMAERIRQETERLDRFIEELLTLHKLEAGAMDPVRERLDVIELLNDIVQDAAFEARARGCRVQLEAPCSFVADVVGEPIYRALENIVRNAVRYTAPNTVIEIRAHTTKTLATTDSGVPWLEICVGDRGPGVPLELCEEIFEPFRRLDQYHHAAPAHSIPGSGLGLAIARRAFGLHGGDICATPREGGGLLVIARLPGGAAAGNAAAY